MEARLQRRIQRYGWDKAVRYYEQYWGQQLALAQRRLLEMAAIQPGEWVVDVACGTGLVTVRAAASVGPAGVVVGTDISAQMVASAYTVAVRHHLRHTTFARMDAEELQLLDGTFKPRRDSPFFTRLALKRRGDLSILAKIDALQSVIN